ncbi:MAG: tetratricopeptide repeat protein [Firmicutes bacterium]|nr:tetratricopeptide repeat protein [Bacillota bacterium]
MTKNYHGKIPYKYYKDKIRNKHFDSDYFNKIMKHATLNPYLAISLLENYMREYSKDIRAYYALASLLITVGRFTEAKKILDDLEVEYDNNTRYFSLNEGEKGKQFEISLCYIKLRYLMYTEQYDKAYKHMCENESTFIEKKDANVFAQQVFCKKKMGVNHSKDKFDHYILRQIAEYSEDAFLYHIKPHFESCILDPNDDCNQAKPSIFYNNIPFQIIYDEIKKYIPGEKALYRGLFEDTYYFKYDNCGKNDGINTNYFVAKVFHKSNEFITMCPAQGAETLPYIDLNYLKEEEKPRVRRLSQIDKFNQKYGKK